MLARSFDLLLVETRWRACLLAIGCLYRVIMCLFGIGRVCLLLGACVCVCMCVCVCVRVCVGWRVVVRWLPIRARCSYIPDWNNAVSNEVNNTSA